jgi:hypothetical protein
LEFHVALICTDSILQAAIEATRVLNLDTNDFFSGPYGEL